MAVSGWFFVVPAALLAVGLVVAYFGVIRLQEARMVRTWPRVTGVIMHSEITVSTARPVKGRKRLYYEPTVKYRYATADGERIATRVKLNLLATTRRSRAERIADRYRPGQTTEVFVDPIATGRSVLEATVTFDDYFVLLVGTGFVVGALVLMAAGLLAR